MATLAHFTGFEYGNVLSISGTGIADTVATSTGGVNEAIAGAARSGGYGLHIQIPASLSGNQQVLWTLSGTRQIIRFYFQLPTLPAGITAPLPIAQFLATAVATRFRVNNVSGKLDILVSSTVVDTWNTVLVAGQWYRVEMDINVLANPWVITWRVGLDDQPFSYEATVSPAQAGATFTSFGFGATSSPGGTGPYDVYYDDYARSVTAGDYPLGAGSIVPVFPGSDGTHSMTANDFLHGDAGTVMTNATTDAWTLVKEVGWSTTRSTTDSIVQAVARSTSYVEILAAPTTRADIATAVTALLAYSAASATADNGGCIVRTSGGFAGVLFGDLPVAQGGNGGALADYSEATNFFKRVLVTQPAAGWTPAEMNQVGFRFGGSTDVSPAGPSAQALMLEAAYPYITPPVLPQPHPQFIYLRKNR